MGNWPSGGAEAILIRIHRHIGWNVKINLLACMLDLTIEGVDDAIQVLSGS